MGQGTEEMSTGTSSGEASTDELSRDIERSRARLSRDVDELGDKVSPSQAMARQKQAARSRLTSMKDKVMGSVHGAVSSVGSTAGSVGSSVGGTASQAVHGIESRTEGNPLAAGVIAFGAGMLASSMFPASQAEQRVTQQGMDVAREHAQPVMDEARSMAQDMGAELKETAREGAQEVKATAQDSAQSLKEEGRDSAQHMKDS